MKLKPYMLVRVKMDDGRYNIVGEVMSFETPEHTVMVRMVPGHPGTLQELPVSRLLPVERKYYSVAYATVHGRGQFPEDMLRYDNAVPVNFEVYHDQTGPKAKLLPGLGDQLIIATVLPYGSRSDFCDARWASFLWSVKRLKVERLTDVMGN